MRDRMLSMCRRVLVCDTNVCQAVFHRSALAVIGKQIKRLGRVTH
jgi:hypothetical protein